MGKIQTLNGSLQRKSIQKFGVAFECFGFQIFLYLSNSYLVEKLTEKKKKSISNCNKHDKRHVELSCKICCDNDLFSKLLVLHEITFLLCNVYSFAQYYLSYYCDNDLFSNCLYCMRLPSESFAMQCL